MAVPLLDAAGRRRSPATMPGYRQGCAPRNKGMRYPADPPRVEEIIAAMRQAGDGIHGARMRALIVVLWRAGLRIHEALMLSESDLDPRREAILVRRADERGFRAKADWARRPRDARRVVEARAWGPLGVELRASVLVVASGGKLLSGWHCSAGFRMASVTGSSLCLEALD